MTIKRRILLLTYNSLIFYSKEDLITHILSIESLEVYSEFLPNVLDTLINIKIKTEDIILIWVDLVKNTGDFRFNTKVVVAL